MKHRYKSKEFPRHVRLHHWLMATPAWRSLNTVARAIYVELAARYNGKNNGMVGLSTREAADAVGVSKATAGRAILELKKRGFIVVTRAGHFELKCRKSSEYRLTEFPSVSEPATKDFFRWAPPVEPVEKDSTVSAESQTVPLLRPNGTSGETDRAEGGSNGARAETVRAGYAR